MPIRTPTSAASAVHATFPSDCTADSSVWKLNCKRIEDLLVLVVRKNHQSLIRKVMEHLDLNEHLLFVHVLEPRFQVFEVITVRPDLEKEEPKICGNLFHLIPQTSNESPWKSITASALAIRHAP